MNWKVFKKQYKTGAYDETHFILGIDLGDDSSVISYYNFHNQTPEVIDISGGYGKPSVPTVMQYLVDTKEWVFGEYALQNRGAEQDVLLGSLIEKLGRAEYVDIGGRSVNLTVVLGLYLKELISNVKNINPKGEIVGIIISVPSYINQEARDDLRSAVQKAGYEKEMIDMVPDRECILHRYFSDKEDIQKERILLLDFGGREIRGGVYDIDPIKDKQGNITIRTQSSFFDPGTGTKKINDGIYELFSDYYCKRVKTHAPNIQARRQLTALVNQYKDLLFQKHSHDKPIRIYYNFTYPPFQQEISKQEIDNFTAPFAKDMKAFFKTVLNKSIDGRLILASSIDTVLCTGGGFEMLWARSLAKDFFNKSRMVIYKNTKSVNSEGAAAAAAIALGCVKGNPFILEDKNQMGMDLGILIRHGSREKFVPIIERSAFWWQSFRPKLLVLDKQTDQPVMINIIQRSAKGDECLVKTINVEGLPERPRGATRLKLAMGFENAHELAVDVTDLGFGELFESSGYNQRFLLDV